MSTIGYHGFMMNSTDPWLDDAQQRVWRQWVRVASSLPSALDHRLQEESGLSHGDYGVLVQLSEAPGGRLRIAVLADALDWERSRLSHQLRRMERRGLVARVGCPEDGRGAFAVLTDEGRARLEQAAPGHALVVRELLFDHLDADGLAALDDVTSGVLERLGRV